MVEKKRRAPDGLNAAGRRLWDETLAHYVLAEHEVQVLAQACRTADMCERIRRKLDREGLMGVGSMGQDVVHPLLPELRMQRAALAALLKSLGLPDLAEGGEAGDAGDLRAVPNQQREAVQSRWGKAHGVG